MTTATATTTRDKTYILYVYPHGRTAKNKGIIGTSGPNMRAPDACLVRRFAFMAPDNATAYNFVCNQYEPEDKRPVAGKSYVKPRKLAVGDKVRLLRPYPVGWNDDGTRKEAVYGRISEVLGGTHISVDFNGVEGQSYNTRFVDFSINEIA